MLGDITIDDKGNDVIEWASCEEGKPTYEVSGDIRDIAETIKDLVPGIDGEALSEELIRLSEEVQCMEENPDIWCMSESDKHAFKVIKNRIMQGPSSIIINDDEDELG